MRKLSYFFIRFCQMCGFPPDKVLLCLTDIFAIVGSAVVAYALRACLFDFTIGQATYVRFLLAFALAPILAQLFGLYGVIPLPGHKELERIFYLVSIVYGVIGITLFMSKSGSAYSRMMFVWAWMISCFAVPLARAWIRHKYSRHPWWGYPLVIFDRSSSGRAYWHYLKKNPGYGLNPVAFLNVPSKHREAQKVLAEAADHYRGAIAMIVDYPERAAHSIAATDQHFTRILVVPPRKENLRKFWVAPTDIGASIGFLVQQRLHDRRRLAFKRAMDLVLCLLGSVVILPLWIAIAIAIRRETKGPVLYRQERIGQWGQKILVHKFRTMVTNSDEILKECLKNDPERRKEWERDQKLKDDPRVTKVGHFLRRYSLDELPQLLDVVTGTMSLVGPRPIVENEKDKYGPVYSDYMRVRPGITGLWQTSGRSDTTYEERVNYDFYYISSWSVWMDIWILFRTIPVVLFGKGAY